uniref:Transposon Tf2-6 polyprotein n=1 Tax=Talaromyces marneffei PM1 TaxID=1077442 RepID=A0A093UM55_TALMA
MARPGHEGTGTVPDATVREDVETGVSDRRLTVDFGDMELTDQLRGAGQTGALDREAFLRLCVEQPDALFDGLYDHLTRLERQAEKAAERNLEDDDLQEERTEEITQLKERVKHQRDAMAELIQERDEAREQLEREGTPLEANADHYPTPLARMQYVKSMCKGEAATHLLPRFRKDSPQRYRDAEDIIEHLKTLYMDENRIVNAKSKLRRLYMKDSKFQVFLSQFALYAQESELATSQWKDELYERLSLEMQRHMVKESYDQTMSYATFIQECHKTANRLEQIAETEKRIRPRGNKGSNGNGASMDGKKDLAKNGLSIFTKALADTGANGFAFLDIFLAERLAQHFHHHVVPLKHRVGDPEDADRRDKNFQSQAVKDASVYSIQKRQDDPLIHPRLQEGIPILHGKTYRRRHTLDLDRMRKGFNEAINKAVIPKKPESFTKKAKRVRFQDQYPETDIALIGAAGFARHIRDKESETFVTSLSELEKAIEDKRQLDDADSEAQEIKEQLPERYHEFADVFSKIKSDELPERKEYDHPAKEYIMENLDKGFIVPSNAPFASPILMAKKPGGGLRFCVDFRKLNKLTKKDRYPLPLIDEVFERISQAKIFTKLDIRQGFHCIRMHKDSSDLTTFRCRYGTFKYGVMPFGLTNGPATFQRLINDIFIDCLDKFLIAFIDDLLIYSENATEHEIHVRTVLQRLRDTGLQASIKKCEFHVTTTKYLGFIITPEGIKVDPVKVETVLSWKTSTTCKEALEKLKTALALAPVLVHYDPSRPTRVETDASDGVVAAVLSQLCEDGNWHLVGYYSASMSSAEHNIAR